MDGQNELLWFRKIKRMENFHVFLWLMKDMSWCNTWVKFGVAVSVPTLLVQFYITWLTRKSLVEFVHNIAVCLWLCANITWMSGEFFLNGDNDWFDQHMTWLPSIFFFTGLGLVAVLYLYQLISRFIPWVKEAVKALVDFFMTSEPEVARCRWCDRNDVPWSEMAVFSYKPSYGGFTGVCKRCIDDPEAEKAYHLRMKNGL